MARRAHSRRGKGEFVSNAAISAVLQADLIQYSHGTSSPAASDRRDELLSQKLPKRPIALEMPLAAHGLAPGAEFLGVQQHPSAPARGARASAGVVLLQPLVDVGGPADIGQHAVRRAA